MNSSSRSESIRVIDARHKPSFLAHILELWDYREFAWYLVIRDIKSRYKSAPLGLFWAIFQPLVKAITLTVCLSKAKVNLSENIPYPLFAFSGLIMWEFISSASANAVGGAASMANLITKVYFPKAVIPITISFVPLFDLLIVISLFLVVLVFSGRLAADRLFLVFPYTVLLWLTSVGLGAWFCGLSLRFHDFRHLSGLIMQVMMFASPVFYTTSVIKPGFEMVMALNPLTTAISGFRWALFAQATEPQFQFISWLSACLIAITGSFTLHSLSANIADTA